MALDTSKQRELRCFKMRVLGGKSVESDRTVSQLIELVNRQLSTVYDLNTFNVEHRNEFIYISFVLPSSYLMQEENSKIFKVLYQTLYPYYTVLNTPKADIVPVESSNLETARALRYRILKGKPTQIEYSNISELISNRVLKLNNQISLDFNDINHILITGQSGSGKSYTTLMFLNALKYLNSVGYYQNELIIVDPKLSSLSKWSLKQDDANNVEALVIPNKEIKNDNDLLSRVNDVLTELCQEITIRQQQMLENGMSSKQFKHKWLIIDELIGLQVGSDKKMKENFQNYLSKLLVMGREVNIHVMLISQSFDSKWAPVVAREQANLLIAMGVGNQLRFMFDQTETEDVVVPFEKGGGLLKIIDNKHPSQLLPVIFPRCKGGI